MLEHRCLLTVSPFPQNALCLGPTDPYISMKLEGQWTSVGVPRLVQLDPLVLLKLAMAHSALGS